MQISKEELDRRLNSPKNVTNSLDRSTVKRDARDATASLRTKVPNTPTNLRVLAGSVAKQTSVKFAAANLHLTEGVVNSAVYSKNPEIKQAVEAKLDRAKDVALDRLMASLGLLTDNKISESKGRDIASISANMSRVVERLSPKDHAPLVQLVVYAPRQRSESDYGVVDV